jgi:hypothetical protein
MKRRADPTRRSQVLLLACAALLLASAETPAQQIPANLQSAIARIDAMAAAEHAKDNVGSVTVGVVHGAQLIWTRSYGQADRERDIPATRDTVLASVGAPIKAREWKILHWHTASGSPWHLDTVIEFRDEGRAAIFEKYLKSCSGSAFAKRHFR